MNYIYIKLNNDLFGHRAGTVLKVKACSNCIPINASIRKRVIDSFADKCVSVIINPSKKVKAGAVSYV